MYVYTYACMYVCMYVCMSVYIYIYMYVYIYIYTHPHNCRVADGAGFCIGFKVLSFLMASQI